MDYIVNFYKNLDTVNLFIFWGVIIVILLLLIFAIIVLNKNKKLEKIIAFRGINIDSGEEADIPTLKHEMPPIEDIEKQTDKQIVQSKKAEDNELFFDNVRSNQSDYNINSDKPYEFSNTKVTDAPEKEAFVAEEHVINYTNDKKETSFETFKSSAANIQRPQASTPQKEIIIPTKPYQKNVLKEMSLNQTSPIGIIKNNPNSSKELARAEDLYNGFTEKEDTPLDNSDKNLVKVEIATINNNNNNNNTAINTTYNKPEEPKPTNNQNNYYKKGNYLEELSKKSEKLKDEIDRTEYELKQEEEAIISYEELMQKKDQIQIIDEEEAVISINELMQKKEQEEKLYNLTSAEDNDQFINELKDFRSDL